MNFRPLLALILFPLAGSLASAQTAEAQQHLQAAVNEVLSIADRASSRSALAERVRPVLLRHLSFGTMTRRAVGPGWRQFTPDQQSKAVGLFSTLIIRSYTNKFTPGEHPVINYKAATSPAAGRVDVPTSMVYRGSHYMVTYRMEKEGGWKVTDVVIEGVSLIANYRTQLDSQFKKGGASAVLSSLAQSASQP